MHARTGVRLATHLDNGNIGRGLGRTAEIGRHMMQMWRAKLLMKTIPRVRISLSSRITLRSPKQLYATRQEPLGVLFLNGPENMGFDNALQRI
jgi:hypothetical protein